MEGRHAREEQPAVARAHRHARGQQDGAALADTSRRARRVVVVELLSGEHREAWVPVLEPLGPLEHRPGEQRARGDGRTRRRRCKLWRIVPHMGAGVAWSQIVPGNPQTCPGRYRATKSLLSLCTHRGLSIAFSADYSQRESALPHKSGRLGVHRTESPVGDFAHTARQRQRRSLRHTRAATRFRT